MEAMLPIEIEMGSLRVALEQQIPEADWAQARFDQLNFLDERRLRQQTMFARIKGRCPALSKSGELTLEGAAWLMDLDGNRFSEPTNVDQLKSGEPPQVHHMEDSHIISTIYLTNIGLEILSLRSHLVRESLGCLSTWVGVLSSIDITFGVHLFMFRVHGSWGSLYMLHFIYEGMSFDHWVFEPSFLSFLSPYHLGLRYVPCLKTTLRPWDQMSSSAASTWTGLIQLCSDYQDREFDAD
ncbi:hypothetical protein CK203_029830 [Vitis vinifera]|uniref:Uncharacterized protein n=1 Tax=Vitis vinifera TaxID=29760 RepID=A0A438IDG7_VITVI|nr:hypothetical protein CK203_029830 [Vitis vinifera]